MNKAILIGNLVADPEMRYTPSGVAVTSFRVATNNGKDAEGNDKPADFHNILVWAKAAGEDGMAGVCAQYLRQGHKVGVVGRITENRWEDKEGGKHSRTEIVAEPFGVEFLTTKEEAERITARLAARAE